MTPSTSQQDNQRILDVIPQTHQPRLALFFGDSIGAIFFQASLNFLWIETVGGGIQLRERSGNIGASGIPQLLRNLGTVAASDARQAGRGCENSREEAHTTPSDQY